MKRALRSVTCLTLLAACSSSSSGGAGNGTSSGSSGGGPTITEHGVVYDYGTVLASPGPSRPWRA